jgi:hypothetical protein
MLPDLRQLLGLTFAGFTILTVGIGLFATLRIAQQQAASLPSVGRPQLAARSAVPVPIAHTDADDAPSEVLPSVDLSPPAWTGSVDPAAAPAPGDRAEDAANPPASAMADPPALPDDTAIALQAVEPGVEIPAASEVVAPAPPGEVAAAPPDPTHAAAETPAETAVIDTASVESPPAAEEAQPEARHETHARAEETPDERPSDVRSNDPEPPSDDRPALAAAASPMDVHDVPTTQAIRTEVIEQAEPPALPDTPLPAPPDLRVVAATPGDDGRVPEPLTVLPRERPAMAAVSAAGPKAATAKRKSVRRPAVRRVVREPAAPPPPNPADPFGALFGARPQTVN